VGGKFIDPFIYTLPEREIRLQIIRVKKVKSTPKKYPRRFAKIKVNPL